MEPRGHHVIAPLEATFQSSSITDDIVARLSPTIAADRWVVRRRAWPLSMFRRSPGPHQEAWIAIDVVIVAALNWYVVEQGAPITTAEGAGSLADRIADDVMKRLHPAVSRDNWADSP